MPSETKVILTGADNFPKEPHLQPIPQVAGFLNDAKRIFSGTYLPGSSNEAIVLHNTADNTTIKEQLALLAEDTPQTMVLYFTGYALLRRRQWFMATSNANLPQIHVNGLSLAEVADIIREPDTARKIVFLDCVYPQVDHRDAADATRIIREELLSIEKHLKNIFILVNAPGNNQAFITPALTRLFEQGLRKETELLSLQDVHDYLTQTCQQEGLPEPIVLASNQMYSYPVAVNTKYRQFLQLQARANELFASENFDAALPIYEEACLYFDTDDEVRCRIRFIRLVNEAETLLQEKQFIPARRNLEMAFELFAVELIKERAENATQQLANMHFTAAEYEQARNNYAKLVSAHPDNQFFSDRLQICINEIKYSELIDKADHYYLHFDFENALNNYEAALEIHQDRKTIRRREECLQFINKQGELREQLKRELSDKIKEEFQKDADALLMSREDEIRRQIAHKVRLEIHNEVQEQIESKAWKHALDTAHPVAYNLYLALFPEGRYAAEANLWLRNTETDLLQATSATHIYRTEPEISYTDTQSNTEENFSSYPLNEKDHEPEPEEHTSYYHDNSLIASTETKSEPEPLPDPTAMSEDELWAEALRRNSLEGYMFYVEHTVESHHIADAYYQISQLKTRNEEEEPISSPNEESTPLSIWQEERPSLPQESIEASEETNLFTEENSEESGVETPVLNGHHYQENTENNGLADYEEELWENARLSNTIQAYQRYLDLTSLQKYALEARSKIASLTEESKNDETLDWERASEEDTLDAYREYIRKYPFGNFYAKARFRIARIEAEIS